MKPRYILTAAFSVFFFWGASAYASVLGTVSDSWTTDMGAYTYFHHTSFMSESVGKQTETYIEYTPNDMAKPVVVNGSSVWGTRTINGAVSYMEDNGMRPMAGINADYFSFTTGIPMGNVIIGGEIVSAENLGQDAVAIRSDGTAFIDWFDVKTTLSNGQRSVGVDCINKWYQNGFTTIFMLNDKFAKNTHTNGENLFVICTPVSGELKIGSNYTLRVDDKFVYGGDVTIPEGKVVFVIGTGGIEECYTLLNEANIGDELYITNNVSDNDNQKWADVEYLASSVGGRIISNGEVRDINDGAAAPRSAVGVKNDGSLILYTIDGRQKGYSYGAKITTVAKRLEELGCVDAINFDGGGSTSVGAVFPGSSDFMLMNRPSDGSPRSVANFVFIRDDRERTDIPRIINVSARSNTAYLSGFEERFAVESVYDTSNYRIENPETVYDIVNNGTSSYIYDGNNYCLRGEGKTVVSIRSGDAKYERELSVYETPERIKVFNSADWKEITSVYTEADGELSVDLAAAAYVGDAELNQYDTLFEWSTEGNIGTINSDGYFTLAQTHNETGKIIVSKGNCRLEIPVTIADYPSYNPFYDTVGHWAEEILNKMYERGIIKGINDGGRMNFYPDNPMTRNEFAAVVCNYRGVDTSQYRDTELDFTDVSDIPPWAQNTVKAAVGMGIMNGKSNDNGKTFFFDGDGSVTRAEAMTVLGRMLDYTETADISFTDGNDIPVWARPYIMGLVKRGAVNGYEDNTIQPNGKVKRSEAVTMLYKLQ